MVVKKWHISLASLSVIGVSAGIITGLLLSDGFGRETRLNPSLSPSAGSVMPVPGYPGGEVDEMIVTEDAGMPVPGSNSSWTGLADTTGTGDLSMKVPAYPDSGVEEMIVMD